MRMTIGKALPLCAAVLGGILLFLGYAGFDQFYLEWIFLLPLFWAIRDQRPKHAFQLGWCAGIVGHAGGFYWVIGMFQVFAGLPWPLAALGLLFLAAANGLLMGVWAWAVRVAALKTRWSLVWVAPVVWTALEKFWPEVFPNYLGASQYQLPLLTQIADLVGILGVSFLVVFINAVLWSVLSGWLERRSFTWRPLAVLAAVLVAVLGYGAYRIAAVERQVASAEQLSVGLIQTNQGGTAKYYDPDAIFREHQAMTVALAQVQPLDLTVWPEGICEIALASSREGQVPAFAGMKTPVLWGAVLKEMGPGSGKVCNTALLTDPSGRILGTYDKSVLVPFGEYIPFGDIFPRLYSWSPYTSRFWPGESEEPLTLGKHRLSVSICYEDIFPEKIRALMRGGREGRRPDVMFNLTNDSWYGKSTEPMEHLALASFRSIENRRALVRVTNTGISAIVDPVGRIVSRTGIWTKETLVNRVPILQGTTVYARYGDLLGWLCILLTAWCIGQALGMAGKGRSGDGAEETREEHAGAHSSRKWH
ncbi:apolipoprotein N-acyltransferase [Geomonas silvestris]|uniref:Apolipoprotein N-acyltransferase n=2 Tax=Geomonas silvestris TaxID=2740184 RepID=A0A6V8MNT4_9BACT|nr:apolipoprotein N-acyltransferase [Geomonas silvestris]